jgi:tripartite-type tricarboxylate transporter receptor subunit TctC
MQPAAKTRTSLSETTLKRSLASLAGCLAAALLFVSSAHAQSDYPSHPITLINPYAAGGPADMLARALAQKLKDRLGQTVVVENKPGGGATLGTSYVARSRPDGYTLLMATSPGNVVGPLIERVPYNGIDDFTFIGLVGNQPIVLVAGAKLGVNNMQELTALARQKPGSLNFASAGTGGPTHLAGELLRRRANIDITHVPYRGASPAIQDVIGGQVQLAMVSLSAALPFVKDGKLKALAYTGDKRSALLPDVPTMAEAGIPRAEISTWYALAAPRGTPPAIIAKLGDAVAAINADPKQQQFLVDQDASITPMSPTELTNFVKRDKATMTELLTALDMLAK